MKRGFTLLELVVVITLIALVSGYVMVNFGRSARVQADKAAGGEVGIAAGADIQGVVAVVVAGAEAV